MEKNISGAGFKEDTPGFAVRENAYITCTIFLSCLDSTAYFIGSIKASLTRSALQ
jgi:hypothetical protein